MRTGSMYETAFMMTFKIEWNKIYDFEFSKFAYWSQIFLDFEWKLNKHHLSLLKTSTDIKSWRKYVYGEIPNVKCLWHCLPSL